MAFLIINFTLMLREKNLIVSGQKHKQSWMFHLQGCLYNYRNELYYSPILQICVLHSGSILLYNLHKLVGCYHTRLKPFYFTIFKQDKCRHTLYLVGRCCLRTFINIYFLKQSVYLRFFFSVLPEQVSSFCRGHTILQKNLLKLAYRFLLFLKSWSPLF